MEQRVCAQVPDCQTTLLVKAPPDIVIAVDATVVICGSLEDPQISRAAVKSHGTSKNRSEASYVTVNSNSQRKIIKIGRIRSVCADGTHCRSISNRHGGQVIAAAELASTAPLPIT